MKSRLSAHDWVNHGLKTLAKAGAEGLKADLLAKSLGVSRGSFYWHFKDINTYKMALLKRWQEITTDRVIDDLTKHSKARDRLTHLVQRAFAADNSLEHAIRNWATHNNRVRRAVSSVDVLRINYLKELLIESGLTKAEASGRSAFIYAASLGRSHVWTDAVSDLNNKDLSNIVRLFKTKST